MRTFLSWVAYFLVIGGVGSAFIGWDEWRLASASSTTPQRITLKQLIDNGPGDNAFIVLSDFHPLVGDNQYVVEERTEKSGRKSLTRAWVPLVTPDSVPPENAEVPAQAIKVILIRPGGSEESIARLAEQRTIEGMVINEIDKLRGRQKDLLEKSYPGADISKVWIIQENRKPRTQDTALLYLVLGGAAILVGGGIILYKIKQRFFPRSGRKGRSEGDIPEVQPV